MVGLPNTRTPQSIQREIGLFLPAEYLEGRSVFSSPQSIQRGDQAFPPHRVTRGEIRLFLPTEYLERRSGFSSPQSTQRGDRAFPYYSNFVQIQILKLGSLCTSTVYFFSIVPQCTPSTVERFPGNINTKCCVCFLFRIKEIQNCSSFFLINI